MVHLVAVYRLTGAYKTLRKFLDVDNGLRGLGEENERVRERLEQLKVGWERLKEDEWVLVGALVCWIGCGFGCN